MYYYYNNKTGESQWVKPKGLGGDDVKEVSAQDASKPSPRTQAILDAQKHVKKDPPKTDEEAVLRIQALWRTRKARQQLHDMLLSVYDKLYDEESGMYYYYNNKTGESQWVKPKGLGSDDVKEVSAQDASKPSPRTQAILDSQKHIKKPPPTTDEEAVLRIQARWRTRKARQPDHLAADAERKQREPWRCSAISSDGADEGVDDYRPTHIAGWSCRGYVEVRTPTCC